MISISIICQFRAIVSVAAESTQTKQAAAVVSQSNGGDVLGAPEAAECDARSFY